ncbi:nucleotidyltransferase family protein [Janthinobacterium sp. MDT1-19]|uniref:nucleotidyltransferase family protein n=1 Tax=Janthinobacterium sp. MDT1-19 TaxID=1259339 RepID=UPI003F203088
MERSASCAPHGLDDLFAMVVWRNPARISLDGYAQRLASKDYAARWPRVTIILGKQYVKHN